MTIHQASELLKDVIGEQQSYWVLSHYLKMSTVDIISNLDKKIADNIYRLIEEATAKLNSGEPLQYVLGAWQFIDIELKTDKRALIPRPETELLAIEAKKAAQKVKNAHLLDVGCGSGCIGLYVKSKVQSTNVSLLDISQDAINLARENADALGIDCEYIKADILNVGKIDCDIIASNPPYIKTEDIFTLDDNVKNYEPIGALDGGRDGLKYYRALCGFAQKSLSEKGMILMEVGFGQSEDVHGIFREEFEKIDIIKDINGIERIVIAKGKKNV